MNVAGIDFSSHAIDVVLIDLDGLTPPAWHRFPLIGQDAFDRTRSVADAMPSRASVFWDDTLAIGLEEPTGKYKPGLGYRVQGAVLSMLPVSVLVQPWPPTAWRKAVGLPGNASKVDVNTFVTGGKGWPSHMQDWTQDACDAYCIALATRDAISPKPNPQVEPQLDTHLQKERAA